jgi:hypothetical protein
VGLVGAAKSYGNNFVAQGSDWLANVVRSSPSALGKYAPILSKAAARGGSSLPATDFILQQTDPDYRQHIQLMKNGPDAQRGVASDNQ